MMSDNFQTSNSISSNLQLIYVLPSKHKLRFNFNDEADISQDDKIKDEVLTETAESRSEEVQKIFEEDKDDHAISKMLQMLETMRRENVQSFLDKKKDEIENYGKIQNLKNKSMEHKKTFATKLQELLLEDKTDEDTEMHKPIITPSQHDTTIKYEKPESENFEVKKDVQLDIEYKLDTECQLNTECQLDIEFQPETEYKPSTECQQDMELKEETELKQDTEHKKDTEHKQAAKCQPDAEYQLETFCLDFEKSLEGFITENRFKNYRNELQLFIRTTINTISRNSVEEVKTKANKIILLLTKSPIYYKGKQLDCCQHPDALNFCLHFTAKTFISSGVVQVSSVSAAAFPIGATIALLWSHLPTFGKLFLGLLAQKCPYVKPSYSDNQYENNESYFKRCRALLMVYGAVIQVGLSNKHPHGIRFGWIWLSSKLRQNPDPFITSNILEAFLQITAFKMAKCYKKQFYKILFFIKNVYLPMIAKIVGVEGTKQPYIKFELFINELIDKFVKFGYISQPAGYIDSV